MVLRRELDIFALLLLASALAQRFLCCFSPAPDSAAVLLASALPLLIDTASAQLRQSAVAFADGLMFQTPKRSGRPPFDQFESSRWLQVVRGSIHEYKNEGFIPRFNSFFFHGGSEGMYASKVHDNGTTEDKPINGKSFIRFESITFRRPKEVADKQNEMQQSTGLVEAIIVEVKNRDKIGGAYLNSNAICCTPALANDGSCKVGEVIIRQDRLA